MLFNSHIFILLFLPITLLGYYAIAAYDRPVPAKLWLIVTSLVFYAYWEPVHLLLLLGSIITNYILGIWLYESEGPAAGRLKRPLLVAGVAGNLLVLGYFKYQAFAVDNVQLLLGLDFAARAVVLPLAISFFTFTQIAYLVDSSRGEIDDPNLLDYTLFVTFFPHLLAGPIIHHHELIPQFRGRFLRFQPALFASGIAFFVFGLLKKVLFADNLTDLADPIFDGAAASGPAMVEAWTGLIAYSLGLYFDFSAYSDMAQGLARLFGIRFPDNFNSPYQATSIIDFWRRWHMTLSRFLRDYLYFALGGNRRGPWRRHANMLVTMLLGGLWHGAGWTFIIWGGLHGLYLLINHAWRDLQARPGMASLRPSPLVGRILTLLAVMLAWVFFRAASFEHAVAMLQGMVGLHGMILPETIDAFTSQLRLAMGQGNARQLADALDAGLHLGILGLGCIVVMTLPNSQQLIDRIGKPGRGLRRLLYWRPSIAWGGMLALGLLFALTQLSQVKAFVYFQF